jgi:hypothetical protein
MRKSWQEKLADPKGLPRVERITPRLRSRWGTGTVVIPAPLEVGGLMQQVPAGKLTTINEIRAAVAQKHRVTICCPMTSGIFAWIAAHAAAEAAAAGQRRITPYWRTLKAKGELNAKYPGGIPAIRKLLCAEGHRVTKRGQKYFVVNFKDALMTPADFAFA